MSREPWVPEPPPERDGYHDLHPPRCPECRTIIDARPDGIGRCPEHGEVTASYSFDSILKSENGEWEGRERSPDGTADSE